MLEKSREGFKYGDVTLRDHMAYDGLHDIFTDQAMGLLTEQVNQQETAHITRAEQDAFAAASHQNAARAWKDGYFDNEVVPVSIPQRKGDPIVFAQDEGIRADTTTESLGKLRPAFSKDGTITAGSASPISDGAAAVIVMSKTKAEELGLTWIAEIGAHGVVAGPDSTLQSQPARAIAKACAKEGIDPTDLDLVEINEAFAAVGIASTRRTRPRPRQGQRQRRRHRRRTPPRHVRRPHRPAPRPRTATPRRRHRRSRTLRRRRTRRRTSSSASPRRKHPHVHGRQVTRTRPAPSVYRVRGGHVDSASAPRTDETCHESKNQYAEQGRGWPREQCTAAVPTVLQRIQLRDGGALGVPRMRSRMDISPGIADGRPVHRCRLRRK